MRYIYRFSVMTTPCEVHLFSDNKLKADSIAEKILKVSKELEDRIEGEILSATVISDSAIKSGVYSTAFMINPNLEIGLEKILIDEDLKILT